MRSKHLAALAAGGILFGVLGFSPQAVVVAQEQPKVSKVAGKQLKAAHDAMQAKKYPEALAKLKEVQAIPGKNPYDEHLMNEMLGFIYARNSQYADAAKALEAGLTSGFLPQAQVPKRVHELISMNYQLKNYDKIIDLGNRAIKGGYADEDTYTLVGQAYYLKGDYKGAAKFLEGDLSAQLKAGKKPKEQLLVLIQNACLKIEDPECAQRTLEHLVTYYPKADYWQSLVDSLYHQSSGQNNSAVALNVFRLASEVDVLKRPQDFTDYAQLAIEAGSPGEAQAVLEKGMAKNVFTDQRTLDKNKRLLELARKQAEANKAALPKLDADAAAGKIGASDVDVGVAYIGYRQYDKAVEAIERGLAKPGLKNPAEARLLLGIAELGAGHKDEARKAFKAVKGDTKFMQLANLWSLHAQA